MTAMCAPVMLRAYAGTHIGATSFFRNRPFLRTLFDHVRVRARSHLRILCHACSIGAEPYSLALWAMHRFDRSVTVDVVATDIDEAFLEIARAGVYPLRVLDGMQDEERTWFERGDDGVCVPDAVRARVTFLPPRSLLDPIEGTFDAVLAMNALTYLLPGEQTIAVRHAAAAARVVVGLTAFHPDTIRDDIEQAGLAPVTTAMREIHDAWGVRCVGRAPGRDTPQRSWQLPPFDTPVADKSYVFCSLFEKASRP